MDIETLKEKLGDQFDPLKSYIESLKAAKDSAEQASNDGRAKFKKLADERDALRAAQERLFEKLGIESGEEIDALPDAKGQAEAARQYDVKLKQLTKQVTDLTAVNADLTGKLKQSSLNVQLEKALNSHEWLDRDTAALLLKSNVEYDGDDAFFKTAEGKLIPLDEGAKAIAQTKQFLLKSQGTGGSGYTGNNGGNKTSGAGNSPPKRSDFANDVEYYKASAQFSADAANS